MGIKLLDKHNFEKKLKEARKITKKLSEESESQEKKIKDNCMKIGSIVIDNNIKIDNTEITQLQEDVKKAKSKIQELQEKKKAVDKDVYNLEESLRNLDGKIGCPKCGQVYEKKKELLFCSKCGCRLERVNQNIENKMI